MTAGRWYVKAALCWYLLLATAQEAKPTPARWPQFRGPDASGVAPDARKYPAVLAPAKNLLWKTALPVGHSSPCVWGDRIFLTGYDASAKKLETICLDRRKGSIVWRRTAPAKKIEKVHAVSNPAVATPACDGERVYVYFASFGLISYDLAGKEQWTHPLPVPTTRNGTGTSPVVAGDLVLLNREHSPMPTLLAIDRRTGKTAWSKSRFALSTDGYATPTVWRHDGIEVVVVHSPGRVAGHALKDGALRWWVSVDSVACSTPVVAEGRLFVTTWMFGEPGDREPLPSFAELLAKYDKDKDGKISKAEFPKDLNVFRRSEAGDIPGASIKVIGFFALIDTDKDGKVDQEEWNAAQALAGRKAENGLLAINPGGKGDVTRTHIAWREKRGVPEVPSPLFYRQRLYMVSDGGILTCIDARTGKQHHRSRLGATGAYFASPVAGDGKIYTASRRGVIVVIAATDKLEVLARNDFKEPICATPALVAGQILVRTERHLLAFGE